MKIIAIVVALAFLGACAVEESVQEELVQEDAKVKSRPTAEQVCAKLDMDTLASQEDRLAYLQEIQPKADGIGFGLGPAVVVTIRALKKENNVAAAEGFARIERSCELATG